MRLPFADNENPDSWASRMRQKRFGQFLALLPPLDTVRILDVGGTEAFWSRNWSERSRHLEVTLLNLEPERTSGTLPIRAITGDARDLSRFGEREFDFCFSNSVIEHVGELADQKKVADEIRRVCRGYFVQTPYRYFPLEPHFQVLGWAQLPLGLRTKLHQRWNLGWMPAEPDYRKARMEVEQIRLLSIREYRLLFADAEIRYEKVGPLVKSLIAVRRADGDG
jgi:hypothetical protein